MADDYYTILGIGKNADAAEIKKAGDTTGAQQGRGSQAYGHGGFQARYIALPTAKMRIWPRTYWPCLTAPLCRTVLSAVARPEDVVTCKRYN